MKVTEEARELLVHCLRCKEVECDGLVCGECLSELRDIAQRAARRPWYRNSPYRE